MYSCSLYSSTKYKRITSHFVLKYRVLCTSEKYSCSYISNLKVFWNQIQSTSTRVQNTVTLQLSACTCYVLYCTQVMEYSLLQYLNCTWIHYVFYIWVLLYFVPVVTVFIRTLQLSTCTYYVVSTQVLVNSVLEYNKCIWVLCTLVLTSNFSILYSSTQTQNIVTLYLSRCYIGTYSLFFIKVL